MNFLANKTERKYKLHNIHGLIKRNMLALQEQIFLLDYILKELIT